MKERTIKIAVWNISGPPKGLHSWGAVSKINAFQWKIDTLPDIAFYLETPEGRCECLPGIDSDQWEKTFWVGTGQKDNPRGILAVRYETTKNLKITRVKKVEGGICIGLELVYGTQLFQVIGVWAIPPEGKRSGYYFESLKKILRECKSAGFLKPDIPCIVVGDTNLNLSARAVSEYILQEGTNECTKNRKDLYSCGLGIKTDDPSDGKEEVNFRLALFPDEVEQNNPQFSGLMQNTLRKNGKWDRCDLMFISDGVKIAKAYLGERGYSDHRPIIFEISVPDENL